MDNMSNPSAELGLRDGALRSVFPNSFLEESLTKAPLFFERKKGIMLKPQVPFLINILIVS